MKDKDTQLIFEAYLKEDRYARENPEEFEDINYAQRARAEGAMDRQSSLDDVAYDMIDTMGPEMEGHEILERLIRAMREEKGVLYGHVKPWGNMLLDPAEQPAGGVPEGLKKYILNKLLPKVADWAKKPPEDWHPDNPKYRDPKLHPNAIIRVGLGSTLDVLDHVLMMGEDQRLVMVNGPQD